MSTTTFATPRAISSARRASRARFASSSRHLAARASAAPEIEPPRPAHASSSTTRRSFFGAALAATLSTFFVDAASAASSATTTSSSEAAAEAVAARAVGGGGGVELFAVAEAAPGTEIYFGNGCFWGRQHEFVEAERRRGRSDAEVTSLVGYAGGYSTKGPDGKVCYYYGAPDTVYERLGHGEVVRTRLSDDGDAAVEDLREFAKTYFANFRKIRGFGMQRLDPQDAGPGYRNMIGLPGGADSPLMRVIEEENVNGMKLVRGDGNKMSGKDASEDDVFNAVWIYDSAALPFYRAEVYHQFHDGLGYKFPEEYTVGLKKDALKRGLIAPTGCPEMRERAFAEFDQIAS